ncbi:MAG: acyltransferase family protein [Chloroflexota bacterium]|nr:MAG: acyltransferase family protein [Chloroflexota bacterium]
MTTQIDRQYYIDWLRVGAMFLLIFYHTGRLFDEPWHINNAVLNPAINVLNRFLDIWHMPLFFILAGASVWFALGRRSPGEFVKERTLRLFVPLIFGMLAIVPPQVYFERVFDGDFTGSFLAWYPNTFHGIYSNDNPASGNLSFHHLWFLAYLFVFSLLLLPLFWYFKKESRKSLISRVAGFLARPGAIFLPTIPLIIVNITLRPTYGWGNHTLISDWANFLFYITVFFYGFWLVSDGKMLQVVRQNRYHALIVANILSLSIYLSGVGIIPLPGAVWLAFNAIACWCWLVAIIGIGSLFFNFTNRILKYASDAVLPVYILHQTLIVTIGFYVIQWNTGVALKYFFIAIATLASSLAIYEVVRTNNITRFLFGLRLRKKSKATLVMYEAFRQRSQ